MDATTRYIIEKVKDRWTVFSLVEKYGKTFKNFVGEALKKATAEDIKSKAEAATK